MFSEEQQYGVKERGGGGRGGGGGGGGSSGDVSNGVGGNTEPHAPEDDVFQADKPFICKLKQCFTDLHDFTSVHRTSFWNLNKFDVS